MYYVYTMYTKKKKKDSVTGNRTPVSRVTGGDTYHYTITDCHVYTFATLALIL